jgi:hypothetical protein
MSRINAMFLARIFADARSEVNIAEFNKECGSAISGNKANSFEITKKIAA